MPLKSNWTPPDGLRSASPRPVRLTRLGTGVGFAAGLLIIGAFLVGIFLARTVRRQELEHRLLDEQGIAADAVITRTWRTNDKANEPRVTYRFACRDSICTNSVQAPLNLWREMKVGAPLAIRFVPSRPNISHPVDWPWRGLPTWMPYVITGLIAAIGSLIAVQLARQMRLLADGRPARGQVTAIRRAKTLVVLYEFQLPDGTVRKGRAAATKRPEIGSAVCVLYDPDNPRRNTLYPLSLARLTEPGSPGR